MTNQQATEFFRTATQDFNEIIESATKDGLNGSPMNRLKAIADRCSNLFGELARLDPDETNKDVSVLVAFLDHG